MYNLQRHRGPDGGGMVFLNNRSARHLALTESEFSSDSIPESTICLGHNRLSVIDLELGWQPMRGPNGQTWISFNGEIYNHRSLRQILEKEGVRFNSSHSDTEVILASYERFGLEKTLDLLDGMFAFALVDLKSHKIHLARDRFGIKPLVYTQQGNTLAFASELRTLALSSLIDHDIRHDRLLDFLYSDCIWAPHTAYANIFKLPPAHFMTVDLEHPGRPSIPERWWQPRIKLDTNKTRCAWASEFKSHFGDAIKRHLESDIPIGLLLSGGVDSSLIAFQMAKDCNKELRAFNIHSNAGYFNELSSAKAVSSALNIDLVSCPWHLSRRSIDRLVDSFAEPFSDSSILPTSSAFQLAKEHGIRVVFSGDGGDELFAGYPTIFHDSLGIQQGRVVWRDSVEHVGALYSSKRFDQALHNDLTGLKLMVDANPSLRDYLEPKVFANSDMEESLHRMRLAELVGPLPNLILMKTDMMSMQAGVEARVPFLDKSFADWALTIPAGELLGGNGKDLPKRRLASLTSRRFAYRPKKGFTISLEDLFKGQLSEFITDPGSHHPRLHQYIPSERIDALVKGPRIMGKRLWRVYVLNRFLFFLDGLPSFKSPG